MKKKTVLEGTTKMISQSNQTMAPSVNLPALSFPWAGRPHKRQRHDVPASNLATELLWDVSRGEPRQKGLRGLMSYHIFLSYHVMEFMHSSIHNLVSINNLFLVNG